MKARSKERMRRRRMRVLGRSRRERRKREISGKRKTQLPLRWRTWVKGGKTK